LTPDDAELNPLDPIDLKLANDNDGNPLNPGDDLEPKLRLEPDLLDSEEEELEDDLEDKEELELDELDDELDELDLSEYLLSVLTHEHPSIRIIGGPTIVIPLHIIAH
jgi:hypothetical protein